MANTAAYMAGRQKYQRPQGMLWAENSGTLVFKDPMNPENGTTYIPVGYEVGADTSLLSPTENEFLESFLILTDDNREELKFTPTRIENKERMINGRMRSYYVADKLNLSTSWTNIPSRSFASIPGFDISTGKSEVSGNSLYQYTTDGGAGGAEMLDWYENHKGSFWVYLSYDKYKNFEGEENTHAHLAQYSQVVEMFISSFDYSVTKRGGIYDFWDISVTLEEV